LVRTDFCAAELRRLANRSKNNNQSRRLLSLAAVLDGMNRAAAARIGGIDRQTLRVDRRVGEASPLANEALFLTDASLVLT
jgi:hypothetical protein